MRTCENFASGLLLVTVMSGAAYAQQAPAVPRPPSAPPAPSRAAQPAQASPNVQVVMPDDDRGARDTRDRLRRVLDQYPPTVRQVLRLDPSLLARPEYLATYPTLSAFLDQHPEVAHNPAYFVGDSFSVLVDAQPADARLEATRGWRNFLEFLPVVAIVFIVTSALAGVIRTLLDQRRWQRSARMQVDMQNKLIDRFSGSEELLAYMQSPTGRGLMDLQAASLASGLSVSRAAMMSPMNDAPLGRIFWSLQAGIVLAATGAGLLIVGARVAFEEVAQPLSGAGILALAVGAGFIVSAGASYVISHRLGLVSPPPPPGFNRETPLP